MIMTLAAIVASFFLGSFPTSYLMGKAIKGIDIRQHGSGNAGATNVYRVVGKLPGLLVLVVDVAKGWVAAGPLAVWGAQAGMTISVESAQAALGVGAVCGHVWSPFLQFRGGKGVATAAGVLLALSPGMAGMAVVIWVGSAWLTRYVSVSSILAVTVVPLVMALMGKPSAWVMAGTAICVIVVFRHRANIGRLLRGEEHHLGTPRKMG